MIGDVLFCVLLKGIYCGDFFIYLFQISGRKVEVDKWFRRLVFLLRRGFFIVPDTDDVTGDDDSDGEE